jgi:hypothetical protein
MDLNDLEENTMDEFISHIYSRLPKASCEHKVFPMAKSQEDLNDGFLFFIFEMILEFYISGIIHHIKLETINQAKTQGLEIDNDIIKELIKNNLYDYIDFSKVNDEFLNLPEKWMNSVGFFLFISEEDYDVYLENVKDDEFTKEYIYSNHYCKIILESNPKDQLYFYYKDIKKPYHYLLNNDFDKSKINKIEDIYALLIKNDNNDNKKNKVYRINFKEIKN